MKRFPLLLALGALVVLLVPAAVAQCNGYDQFQTEAGTQFNFDGIGVVDLQGVPIDSSYGNADTIIQRTPPPPGSPDGQCSLSIFALYLKSTKPVTLQGGVVADLYVTINNTGGSVPPQPDALTPSTGTVTITPSGPDGGTFDSTLTVNADLIFVKPGTNPTDPRNYVAPPRPAPPPGKRLVGIKIVYHTAPPSGYPSCLPADVFYIYEITGSSHPHIVKAAVNTTCGTGNTPCICKALVQNVN